MAALVLCLCSLPAMADLQLFSDLGTGSTVYSTGSGWLIGGSNSGDALSDITADLFTVSGVGNFSVTQIDLGVTNLEGPDTFDAAIFTDVSGAPGSDVGSVEWNSLSTSTPFAQCCGLVSITGITGLTLTGGQSYFLILGPANITQDSENVLMSNTLGVSGDVQYSTNGGTSWNDDGTSTLGAFDVLGNASSVPEPGSLLLFGTVLIGILGIRRRKSNL
jgi:hypothetical protein